MAIARRSNRTAPLAPLAVPIQRPHGADPRPMRHCPTLPHLRTAIRALPYPTPLPIAPPHPKRAVPNFFCTVTDTRTTCGTDDVLAQLVEQPRDETHGDVHEVEEGPDAVRCQHELEYVFGDGVARGGRGGDGGAGEEGADVGDLRAEVGRGGVLVRD
ncbi:hypothetical protein BDV95DRAFT_814 [Massariosphaeria phaeospora]|uniref:Uncharacterized protein n=1 Tax=Massariosphaeria phaeospora TaxID=100035 RepID=A0A7C8MGA3_9PLEO|nr:hypothetical protein BDV95DRAFT_814 [Massariosphaeria phaeospora]